jgi:hypothetical protein
MGEDAGHGVARGRPQEARDLREATHVGRTHQSEAEAATHALEALGDAFVVGVSGDPLALRELAHDALHPAREGRALFGCARDAGEVMQLGGLVEGAVGEVKAVLDAVTHGDPFAPHELAVEA